MDKGLIPGGESTSHDSGNDILYTIEETGQQVLIEGDEYHLCKAALMNTEIHEYKNKTNKEILEDIYTRSSCMVKEGEANVGDFIICKLAVRDKEKRNLTGTIAEIVSIMQKEHGCRVVDGAEYEKMKKGGKVGKLKSNDANYGKPPVPYSEIPYIHETSVENAKNIILNGFRLPQESQITKGIYTIPIIWKNEKFNRTDNTQEIAIFLKDNTNIFWTNSERPTDYYLGYGNKFYEELYKELNLGHKSPKDDWNNKEYQKDFSRRMENWLKKNGYSGIQQGGEIVITDLKAIDYIEIFNRHEYKKGGSLSKTPAPKKERIYGSKTNPKGTSATGDTAKSIKFSESTLETITNKVDEHNQKHPDKKVTLEIAKAVVRRGMGAYSSTHRPTIRGGKPNSRVAWGLARLNAFLYKAVNGKSKSGKYSQDNDLLNELGIKHKKFENGGSVLLAPNGKSSNLNEKQWHLVRTPEFKAWFGDWENSPETASKVVDENGEPLVVYHGTFRPFNIFEVSKDGGFYFTEFKRIAELYSLYIKEGKTHESINDNPIVLSCFLNIRKISIETIYGIVGRNLGRINKAKNKRYDGLLLKGGRDYGGYYDQFIAFESNQIKLADGSNTTFDGSNADIRFKDGGEVGFQPPYPINEVGGYDYTGKAKETAKKVDLLSLPRNVDGTHCGNCFFQEQGICVHKDIMLPVTDRMCCAVWDNSNSDRSYEKNLQKDKGKLPENVEQFPKNEGGGYTYSGKALEIAETFDLITLPKKIEGTNCSNCGWFSPYKDGGFCFRTNIWLPVTARMSCAYWNSLSVDRDWGILKEGGKITNEENETYKEWRRLVNMSAKELEKFYETEEGREAGLKRKEAADLGIRYGRESARWIIKMKQTPKNKWSDKMWEWADRQISFIKRMSGNKGELFDEKGNKTRKHTALLIWGHNPLKKSKMSKGGTLKDSLSSGYNLLDIAKIHNVKYSNIVKEFKKGVKYELGFTDNPALAMDVAKDNLFTNPNYYSIVFKMENGGLIEEALGENFYIAARHLFKIELASRGLYLLPNDKFMVDGKFYSVQFFIEKDENNKVYSADYIIMESPIQDQDKVREFFDLIQEDIKDRPLNQIMVDDLYDKDVEEWEDKDFENYKYLLVTYRDKVDDIDEYEMQDKYITSGTFDFDVFDFDYLPLEYFLQSEIGTLYRNGGEIYAKYSEEEILNSISQYQEDFKLLKYLASRMSWNDFLQSMTSSESIYSRFGKAFRLSNKEEKPLTYNDIRNVSGEDVSVYVLVNKDKKLQIGSYVFEDSKSAMKFVLSNKMSRAEIKVFKVNSNDLIVYDIEQITTYIYSPLILREYVVGLKSFWESLK